MPRIVGSKVKINALATIVGVIVAGALAGVAGMFLSLPVIAVFKIIFDRTENMQQWGVLLGDERPAKSPMQFPIFSKKKTGRYKSKSRHKMTLTRSGRSIEEFAFPGYPSIKSSCIHCRKSNYKEDEDEE